MKNKNTLFITYDGMSDSLGQSQIMPYLKGISNHPRNIYLLSFEKKNRIAKYKKLVNDFMYNNNIHWYKLSFTKNFGKVTKIYDIIKLIFLVYFIVFKNNIKIIHGRGLIPSFISVIVKYSLPFLKIKNIFDYRGMWPDERLDNNILKKNNFFDTLIYKFLKKIDNFTLNNSNFIIFLTQNIKSELKFKLKKEFKNSVIIPCCVDYNFFNYSKKNQLNKIMREKLSIPYDTIIINYNGSLTGVYQFYEMIYFFKKISQHFPNSIFVVTTHDLEYGKTIVNKYFPNLSENIKLFEVPHFEIPNYLSISDICISFIKETYARKAMSPTKLAESLAMGIPVLYNKNIGDVENILNKLKCGKTINYNDSDEVEDFCKNLKSFIKYDGEHIVLKSKEFFDIAVANEKYKIVYSTLD